MLLEEVSVLIVGFLYVETLCTLVYPAFENKFALFRFEVVNGELKLFICTVLALD